MEPAWGRLGTSWDVLGGSWGVLGASWGCLGGVFWAPWGPLGSWGCLGTVLGAFWDHFGTVLGWFWSFLGIDFFETSVMNFNILEAFWECFGVFLPSFLKYFLIALNLYLQWQSNSNTSCSDKKLGNLNSMLLFLALSVPMLTQV